MSARFNQMPQRHNMAAVGLMAAAAIAGYSKLIEPLLEIPKETPALRPTIPKVDNMGNELVGLNMNTQGRIKYKRFRSDLNQAVREERADFISLQETTAKDVKRLQGLFPNASIYRMGADSLQDASEGGLGNMIVAFREDVTTLPSETLPGKDPLTNLTNTVASGARDLMNGDTSLASAKSVMRENRVIGGLVMKAYDNTGSKDVTIMTTHIGGQRDVRTSQTDKAFEYIKRESDNDNPAIVCGDFNNDPNNIIRRFSELGYYVDRTGPTTDDQPHPIDACAYKGINIIGLADTKVLRKYKSDHYMLRVRFRLTAEK